METPICDFVRQYADSGALRLHMPGHKGLGPVERLDITEIHGADSLYEAGGIIKRSEENASALFGCPTFYSTEGSSQCIRAMVYLAVLYAKQQGRRPLIAAARNVHQTFLSAAALLDVEVEWLYPEEYTAYLSCHIDPAALEAYFAACETLPVAVYVTSPDYLGELLDVGGLAELCHRHGVLLLVDNAHGAYLRFFSLHPMELGADMCCASAHKTLPVLTGGAYLHLRDAGLARQAKHALALFGSTSPSYLILQSLDAANAILEDRAYLRRLGELGGQMAECRARLREHGLPAPDGVEPLKLTLCPRPFGYTGTELAGHLRGQRIECEFADPDFLVLMLSPAIAAAELQRVVDVLTALPRRAPIRTAPPRPGRPERVLSIREAMLAPSETLPASQSVGRILAAPGVSCPPAVPILICGERIDPEALACMEYYGIQTCRVVQEA